MPAPLFHQLKEQLRQRIVSGELRPGDRLPSLAGLCAEHGISAITARRALTDLVAEGLLRGEQGRGMFVAETRHSSGLFGLVLPGIGSGYIDGIRHGIERELGTVAPLLLGISDMDPEREASLVENMAANHVAGVLLIPSTGSRSPAADARLRAVIAAGLHLVQVDRSIDLPVDRVGSDNHTGGVLAAAHLLDLGHRRLAFVYAHPCLTFTARQAGWEAEQRRRGIVPQDELIRGGWEPGQDYEACGYLRTLELFHLPQPPTAIYAGNDPIALGVLRALRFLGRAVPATVSVVGTDDADLAQSASPPLTTVRQDCVQIGSLAVAALRRRIAGAVGPAEDLRVPTTLVVRGSSGPLLP